jgi:tripartite-type tricarboxylate transporter receptor subunit TctC
MGFRTGRFATGWACSALLALASTAAPAAAQSYPSADIRMICAFPAGSGADVIVRFFAEKLRPLANRTVLVENKPGAGGAIAAEYLSRSRPDGHTIYVHAANTVASMTHLLKKPPIDPAETIQIAATINQQAFMLTVLDKSPWKTIAELTSHLKEKKDKASYAVTANSGVIMGAIYKEKAGLEAVEVKYRLAQDSLNDMASGRIDFGLHDPVFALGQMREKRLRILAVASARRLKSNPDLPTMTESGIPMDLVGWFAAMVPLSTPKPIVMQINKWFSEIVAMKDTQDFLIRFGGDPWIATPEEAQARLLKDIKDWGEYVRVAKLTPQ